MDIEEAKDKLRAIYAGYGFDERPVAEGELCFFDRQRDYPVFSVSADEIREFADVADNLSDVSLGPVETCILAPNLREQWVEALDPFRSRAFSIPLRERVIRFGDSDGDGPYVEIGGPSALFRNFYRDKGEQFPFFQERLVRRIGLGRTNNASGMFRGILTVRVCNLTEEWDEASLKKSKEMIESCLFELTYLREIALDLKTRWPLSIAERRRARPFRTEHRVGGDIFPLRRIRYDENVTRFYQRAISTDDAYTSFISLYHILEYFFISVSDAKLYSRLERIVNAPEFSAHRKQLDRIITSVDEHTRESDETEMLKGVLSEFVDEDDLLNFLQEYENQLEGKLYTDKTSCFGYELEKMTFKSGHLFGPVAKRIKTIRNALVHSSDRYERKDRYVPGEDASRFLTRELPLLRFLAEKVIIATAQSSA